MISKQPQMSELTCNNSVFTSREAVTTSESFSSFSRPTLGLNVYKEPLGKNSILLNQGDMQSFNFEPDFHFTNAML